MKRQKISIPLKVTFLVSAFFIAIVLFSGYALRVFTTSGYFSIKEVVCFEAPGKDCLYFKGKNIFLLDLPRESALITRSCPDCLRVRLVRVLPDHLFVEFVKRKPVALVELYRYFAVDKNGILFEAPQGISEERIPLITGLKGKISGVRPGEKTRSKELSLALLIINEAEKFRNLSDYKIQKIDVEGTGNITILIPVDNGSSSYLDWQIPEKQKILEVRISQGNILEKLAVMSGLINQERDNLKDIKYIDLRFREPVIKFKDAK